MFLKALLEGIPCVFEVCCPEGCEITGVWDDSRRVTPGSLFAALPPVAAVTQNGDTFIEDALVQGAVAVVLKPERLPALKMKFPKVCFVPVDDPRDAFRRITSRFYGEPSSQVKVTGITGTNGKTTITYFLESIIKAAGQKSGVVGTVNCRVGEKVFPTKNTTPGFLENQIFLASLAEDHVGHAVMEVSSHALAQGRVDLIDFAGAVFTNLTGDHLDFHKTMEEYFLAKAKLFTGLKADAFAVINVDDPYGQRLVPMTKARVFTYGLGGTPDVTAVIESFDLTGTLLNVKFKGHEIRVRTHFIGEHNIHNILAAFAAGLGLGFSPLMIKDGIESLACVPGRLERVAVDRDYCVFIDYAHTDDGLRNVLECLQKVPHRRILVVFGAGGDRDRTKRPRMGKVAFELADLSILTSDNPRSEDPDVIIAEIAAGFPVIKYEVVPERESAIRRVMHLAGKDDIVLLAGKGHETYQVLKDKTVPFVERDIVMSVLKA